MDDLQPFLAPGSLHVDDMSTDAVVLALIRALAEGERRAGRDVLADLVADVRVEERAHLRRCLSARMEDEHWPTEHQMLAVMALADGIRDDVAHPDGRLATSEGRRLLSETIGGLLGVGFERSARPACLDD